MFLQLPRKYLIWIAGLLFPLFFMPETASGAFNFPTSDSFSPKNTSVEVMLRIADSCSRINNELALKYANDALSLARSQSDMAATANCYTVLGMLHYDNANNDKSLHFSHLALNHYNQMDYRDKKMNSLLYIGLVHNREGILDSALYYYNIIYQQSNEAKDTLWQIRALRSLGNVYYKQGQFDLALTNFHQGLSLAKRNPEWVSEQSKMLNNLGILYSDWEEFDKSLAHYKEALAIMDSMDNIHETSRLYNNIGNIYSNLGKSDSALIYYMFSLNNRIKSGDISGQAFVYNNLGMLYGNQEKYEQALEYFNKSLLLFEQITHRSGIVMALMNIGFIYDVLKDYELAVKYHTQSMMVARSQGFSDEVLENLSALKTIYSKTNQWEKAYKVYSEYIAMNDSIRRVQNMELIKDLEVKYEYEKNKSELNLMTNLMKSSRLEKNKTRIIIGVVVLILILLILTAILILRHIRVRNDLEYNKLKPALLRYQLNPQFIRSSLTGIKELVSKNRIKESGLFLSGFARLIRVFIDSSSSQSIVLDKEIDTLRNLLKLHQLRYNHKLIFDLDIESHVETDMLAVPPFLFFPVIVHIINGHINQGDLKVHLLIDSKESSLTITCHLVYFLSELNSEKDDARTLEQVNNVASRVKLLNKSMKERIVFSHQSDLFEADQKTRLSLNAQIPIKPL
jgi:tetratricopeptide (TPR) repeat protein